MIKRYIYRATGSLHKNKYKTLNTANIIKQNVLDNVAVFKQLDPTKNIIAVLKANAYGHGIRQIAKVLNNTDIEFIAVDGYFEANRILPITKHKVLVMGYILPENAKLLDNKKCSFVIQDIAGLKALGRLKRKYAVHLELNTGMNRLGLQSEELNDYLEELKTHKNLTLEGVMTHLADADNADLTYTKKQALLFDQLVGFIISKGFSPKFIHIAQTAGSTKCTSVHANTERIGIGLYGINPLAANDPNSSKLSGLKPALELTSTIIKVIDLGPSERISYNGIYKTRKQTKIGVLPLGYYEWVPRELSNLGVVTSGNKILPIRGRVCMNHTMIDISGTSIGVGDKITIINADPEMPNSIDQLSQKHNLFSYNLLTRISESVRREII